jgi:uncharacterized protein with HEPN domain
MNDKDRIITDYLNDILDSIVNIKFFISELDYPTFQNDIKTQYAVIRALEIIGEASKKVPASVKANYPSIPWRFMAGMRDKLIHDYFGVDTAVVWNTANDDIIFLEQDIRNLIANFSE